MTALILAALKRTERLEAMRHGFAHKTDPGTNIWMGIIVVAVVGLLVILILLLANRAQQDRQTGKAKSPQFLFKDVLRRLKLGFKDRALLRRIANDLRLENPAVMLLTPQIFAETIHVYLARKPGSAKTDMTRLTAICRRLFDQEIPPPRREKPKGPAPEDPQGRSKPHLA